MENKKIGVYLQNKRKELKFTQKDLADQFNVTYQAVSRWETGESIPDIETLCLLADFYHVSVDEILQREKVVETDENPNMIIMVGFVSSIAYILGYAIFLTIEQIWLHEVALLSFFVFAIGGLLPINIIFFTKKQWDGNDREKSDYYIYGFTYILLIVLCILVLL
jgi:transcriptional regulator with XRE-family HTH domain